MPKTFLLDDFTVRLLEVITELTRRDAMPRKGDFCKDILGVPNYVLNKVERHERNFTTDQRDFAKHHLNVTFGVRKSYWTDPRSFDKRKQDMFEFEPPKRRQSKNQKITIHTYTELLKELENVKKERDKYKKENEALKQQLQASQGYAMAAEPTTNYTPHPDKDTDKTPTNKKTKSS